MQSIKIPIYWQSGRPVYQFCGAEGEGSESQQTGATDDKGKGTGATDDKDKGATGTGQQQTAETVSKADLDAVTERMKAADRRAAAAEAKVTEFENKNKTELELAQQEAETAKGEATKAAETLKGLRIENEFLRSNKHDWQSPSAALKLSDLSGVTISDDGKVTGLEAALDKCAKDNPFLLKPKGDGKGKETEGASGASNNGGGAASSRQVADKEKRFPALRGR